MKKIKLTGKLSLNKMKVAELNNQNSIIGGKNSGPVPETHVNYCNSTPLCCLTLNTCTSKVCPSNPNLPTCEVSCPPPID